MVTGLSGSGKTAALKALEDIGYFCVDNLPVGLLPKFVQLSVLSGEVLSKVGIGMDSREKAFLTRYREAFGEVERLGIRIEVLFLDAEEDVLLRRFSETRRVHPLAQGTSVPEGIRRERELLQDLKDRAELVIDTSRMSVHDLKKTIWDHFQSVLETGSLQVNLMSFGFRHGIPHEADIVLDVRFLPNPYFVPELKSRTGTDPGVRDFVFSSDTAVESVGRLADLLKYLLPLYEKEGKRYLTVAVGCTGGRHRSVAVAEELAKAVSDGRRRVGVVHRDMEK